MKNKKEAGSFSERVHRVVQGIPRGCVMTYGEVAQRAGFPCAGRAVGTLMRKNRDARIPCHRVVCSDGRVGRYNRGTRKKIELLTREGAVIIGGIVQNPCRV